jgi:glycosyltransferase involved in cell wall biosynthesis
MNRAVEARALVPMISVVICTHNPREAYLQRTVEALRHQTLSRNQWELLIVDNRSKQPLKDRLNLSWHPQARLVAEPELGLTMARLRGIKEARGELLIFVDDDNVLDQHYLSSVVEISASHKMLGVWSGELLAEYECPPAPPFDSLAECLAVRTLSGDTWANHIHAKFPYGAGMCVRAQVAHEYASRIEADGRRRDLDRKGDKLFSGGDLDIARTAHALGLGTGTFKRLSLTHLIPSERTKPEYLFRLAVNGEASARVLDEILAPGSLSDRRRWLRRMLDAGYDWLAHARATPEMKLRRKVQQEARKLALATIRSQNRTECS